MPGHTELFLKAPHESFFLGLAGALSIEWLQQVSRVNGHRLPTANLRDLRQSDIVLRTGDVVFLEARDEEVFFTGGLLPPGKHVLPRDHDLDAIEAVTMVHGPFYNGAFGGSNLSGALIAPGLGSPSPTLLVVLRRIPGRGQVPIAVDLRSALRYPQERLVIRPGDVLVLQEKPSEALLRFVSQTATHTAGIKLAEDFASWLVWTRTRL